MAYFITICIFSSIFWYVIKFTASFGWKVSWVWWYAGIFAILFQFLILDTLASVIHWIIYQCSHKLAKFLSHVRLIKQAEEEAASL